jgi:hypothetical protein
MSHSVKITTPIPSPEDIASDLGVTGRRLDGLLALVNRRTKTKGGFWRSAAPAKKAMAKKAPAKRATGKLVRATR